MQIRGCDKIRISPLLYSGKSSHVTEMENAVYAPSSTLKINSQQISIANLKIKDYLDVGYTTHNDTEYIISFNKNNSPLSYRILTIPIGSNSFFQLRTTPSYTFFCEISSIFQCY